MSPIYQDVSKQITEQTKAVPMNQSVIFLVISGANAEYRRLRELAHNYCVESIRSSVYLSDVPEWI